MEQSLLGDKVFSHEKISFGVNSVAQQLNSIYSESVIITVVPGGILFTADLVRQLHFEIKMDYISCPHTPGDRNNTSEIVFHNNTKIDGQDVIIVDDAIESGGTMKRLVQHLSNNYFPRSLAIATLFVKPGRVDIPYRQFYGYEMESDELLIGYGMPWEHKYRNLSEIYKLNLNG